MLLAILLALSVAPGRVAATEGYRLSASTVYRIDAAGVVTVEATYRMTNTKPDRNLGGGRYEYYYFSGITVPVGSEVADLTVQVDGRDAEFEVIEDIDGFTELDVSYRSNLRYDRTATTVVRYRLVGGAPRSEESFERSNAAYASFSVYTWADPARGSVRIEVPADWTVEYVGSDLTEQVALGVRVLEATEIADPDEFWVAFTTRNDAVLESSRVEVGGARFEVRSWPGDDEWAAFAKRQVTDGIPLLEDLIGAPWPDTDETDVIEASTPYLRGYGGYYYAGDSLIEVGEDLDSWTMLHELSHAWFNSTNVEDRWISEGLADAVSALAATELGATAADVSYDPDDPDAADVEPFPLNAWRVPDEQDDPAEYYGYSTSYAVVRGLFDEIGERRRTELLAALIRGTRAYQGEGDEVVVGGSVGWRELLDLAEQIGGSTELAQTYRDTVLAPDSRDELDLRDETLAAYAALVERGGTWAAPEAVRGEMARWRFTSASEQIADADAALDVRDELDAVLEPIGLEPTAAIEAAYQDAPRSLDAVTEELGAQLGAAGELAALRSELAGVLAGIDLDAPALRQAAYEDDPIGIVDLTGGVLADARRLSATDAELDAALEPIGVTVPALARNAFATDPAAAQARTDDLLDAARQVAAAHRERDGAGSFVERIGAIGSSVDGRLDAAAAALTGGDTDAARTAAAEAVAEVDRLNGAGARRLGVIGGVLALLALVTTVLVVRVRRAGAARPAPDDRAALEPIAVAAPDGPASPTAGSPLPAPAPDAVTATGADPGAVLLVEAPESGDGPPDLTAGEADAGQAVPDDPDR